MFILQTQPELPVKRISAHRPGKLVCLRAVWSDGQRWRMTGLGWLPTFPVGSLAGLPILATVCVHGTLAEYRGWLLDINEATGYALVIVFDDILNGGCWRQQWIRYEFIEAINL